MSCPRCDRHDDPRFRPWAVHLTSTADDETSRSITVARTNGSHLVESDAAWLRKLVAENRVTSELPSAAEVEG